MAPSPVRRAGFTNAKFKESAKGAMDVRNPRTESPRVHRSFRPCDDCSRRCPGPSDQAKFHRPLGAEIADFPDLGQVVFLITHWRKAPRARWIPARRTAPGHPIRKRESANGAMELSPAHRAGSRNKEKESAKGAMDARSPMTAPTARWLPARSKGREYERKF